MFKKHGSPRPFKVASSVCEVCGKNKATKMIDGKMVCEECSKKM